jgi:hypothetical protein
MKKLLLVFFVLLVGKGLAQIYAPEGINMPGAWNSWTNPPTNALALACSAQTSGGLITVLTDDQRRYHTTFQSGSGGVGSGTGEWLFTSGPSGSPWNNKWCATTVTMNTIQAYTYQGASNNSITITSGKYYTVNLKDNGYGNTEGIFMETSGSPVSIASVVDNNKGAGVNDTVTVTLSGTPSTEEKVFVRYTTDSWSTHKFVLATGSGTTWKAVIPAANVSSSMVGSYKGVTSTVSLADTMQAYRVALYTLYSKDGAPITATTAGNWSSASTWNIGRVPSDGATIIIDANVTIDQDVNILNLTINSGKTLTATSTKTLTIASGGAITNNGTFTHGSGTVVFAGLGTVTGTVGFNNVTMNGGVNYGSSSTINGTMTLNNGAWVDSNSPTYGSGATLKYNTGGTYGRWLEWKDSTGAGYPANVQISASTTVNLFNSDESIPRKISGNLNIDAGSSLIMLGKKAPLTVLGNVTLNGTASLTLSDSTGGDLKLYGNLAIGVPDSLKVNKRAIFFQKDGTQTVSSSSGSVNIPYVVIGTGTSSTTVSLSGVDLLATAPNGGNAITFKSANDVLDLNGKNLILGTATFSAAINGSGSIKGNSASNISILGTGALGTLKFASSYQTLNKLTIDRTASGTVTLGSNLTVYDTLKVTSGIVDLNGNTVTLGSSAYLAETAGNVITGTSGAITTTRTLSAGALTSGVNIAGLGAKITTASALGSTVITRGVAAQTVLSASGIKRYFDITPTNNASLNATLEFNYDAANDLNSIAKANLKLFKSTDSGSNWSYLSAATNDTGNAKVTLSGIASFSRWTLANGPSTITSIASGNWSNASTWTSGIIPLGGMSAIVNNDVILDTNVTVGNLTINAGKTLASSNGAAKTLTLASGSTLTVNGTFTPNDGAVIFAGAGTIAGTTAFNNVTINGAVNFGTASTINGILTVTAGSNVATNAPTYGASSTLRYNVGTGYNKYLEWSDTTGKGYPANVLITGATTLNVYNGDSTVVRRMSGNLTIDNGSVLSLLNKKALLTVNGNVVNNGIITLSDQAGGDLTIKGNFTNNGTFNANSRSLGLKGSTLQTVGGTTNPLNLAYVSINNAAGIVLTQNVVASKTTWLTAGKVLLGNYNYVIGDTVIGTFSASNMLVTNGAGVVKKIYTQKSAFTFPVGDTTGTAEYAPVSLTNNGTFTADTISVAVVNAKHPNNSNATDYLSRYWTLSGTGATVNSYGAVFTYNTADVAGTESNFVGAVFDGSKWTTGGTINTTAHTLTVAAQTAFGSFTAGAAGGFSSAGHVAVKVIPQGFYNGSGYLNASDTVLVLLANVGSPYAIVDSAYAILDSLTFTATATLSAANSGTYYVVIKHRNSIETWSASGVAYTKGSTTSFDFTTAAAQAYGSNETEVATGVYGLYSGDCNQDGYVDPLDLSLVDQDSFNYVAGRAVVTDINGDGFVDPLDLSIVDQNSFNYIGVKLPASGRFAAKSKAPQGIHYNEFKATQVK